MKFFFVVILLTNIFVEIALAGPEKKVTSSAEISVKESYSVALIGMETETYRIQTLQLKRKTFFMASQLVNGELYKEKAISPAEYNSAKKATLPLAALGNSDLCTKPVTITIAVQQKTETKVCSEKPEVQAEVIKFNDQIKSFISKD